MGEKSKVAWICLTCLTGENAPGDRCKGLLLHFGEFLPLPQTLASLNPKRIKRDKVNAVPPPASFVT